jgi:hypothetical protein
VKWHFVFLYLCFISLLRSEFGLASQLNPWRGAWYLMLCSDFMVVVSRVMCVILMSIWWRASISTRIGSMPCWVPRVDLDSGVWHLVEKVCCVVFFFGSVFVVGEVLGGTEGLSFRIAVSAGSCV